MEKKLQKPKRNKSLIRRIAEYDISIGKYKQLLFENIVMMISSGINIVTTLEEFKKESNIKALDDVLEDMISDIKNGQPFWMTLAEHKILDGNLLDIVRIGEESGNLAKNLEIVLAQKRKDKEIRSKIQTASLYPAIVLIVLILVGLAIAMFVLPNLTSVYKSFNTQLPPITQFMIDFGDFMQAEGQIILPLATIGIVVLLYFIFIHKSTNALGQKIMLNFPIIGKAIKDLEMSRFGYLMHSLLNSGFKVVDTLDILARSTSIRDYKKFYDFLAASISNGDSFALSFQKYKPTNKLFPLYARQSVISGERTGQLTSSFKQIGDAYQKEYDYTTANMYVLLEPILLIMVWIGVFVMALAVILPIYNLMSSFSDITDTAGVVDESAPIANKPAVIGELQLRSDGRQQIPIYNEKDGDLLYKVADGEIYEFIEIADQGYSIILRNGNIGWVEEIYVIEIADINPTQLVGQ